jgi:hypothetical protein
VTSRSRRSSALAKGLPSAGDEPESCAAVIASLTTLEDETLRLALSGDAEAGMHALKLCAIGLSNEHISDQLRLYLVDRLTDVVSGIKAERALNIEIVRTRRGRPADPFPAWHLPLAAFGALLSGRNYIEARIEEAMDEARQRVFGKRLDPRDARRIRAAYPGYKHFDDRTLVAICDGEGLRGEMEKYPPVSKT